MATQEKPKITLYWLNQSRSQRIVWLLQELKLDFDVEIFYRNKETMLAPPELEKIHPLGKAPVVAITPPGSSERIVLAESGFVTEYLCDYFAQGTTLVPARWKEGQEGKLGGETEAWRRFKYFLHYPEGSLMPILLLSLFMMRLRSSAVPFFFRPFSSAIANRIFASFIFPNAKKHLAFLDQQLSTSGGDYLCGKDLTAADILMSFPLIAAKDRFVEMGKWEGGSPQAAFPRVWEYIERLEKSEGYIASTKKIEELDGKKPIAAL